jgi:hypothetical protein
MAMKRIKLTVISWFILLCSFIGFGQDTVVYPDTKVEYIWPTPYERVTKYDTFIVTLQPNPVKLTIGTEPVEKNEALNKTIEAQNEQTDALNVNLSRLNTTIRDLPYVNVEAKEQVLSKYHINIVKINRQLKTIWGTSYLALLIFLVALGIYAATENKLYWTKRNRWLSNFAIVIIILGFGYVLPKILSFFLIDNYSIWQNLDKLF